MPEGETPAVSVEELQRENRELRAQIRELNAEARDFRLERNEARRQVKDLEGQVAELNKKGGSAPSEELDALRRENRTLKHRGVFDRVAREAGARTSGKALEALWDAIKYDADGEADPAAIKARIDAVRADYDFLFDGQPAEGETPRPEAEKPAPAKPGTPPVKPGPGVGRGAPADGAGTVKVRKSDLQSFDPRVNPMLDRHRAAEIEAAKKSGKLVYIDE